MTSAEFSKGWVLLTVQPWGRRYTEDTASAEVQAEFYFTKLKDVSGNVWWQACELRASGDAWPSLDEMRDTISRLTGGMAGHPAPNAAWALVARCLNDERRTVVWTDEIAEAFGDALALADNAISARMAFLEKYTALLELAKARGSQAVWKVSLGHDKDGRADVIQEAVARGQITAEYARKLLPPPDDNDAIAGLVKL